MVATKNEIEDATRIMLQWLPETYAYDMMTEIYETCIQHSENESLRLTVEGLITEIQRQDGIKWAGIEDIQ